jgi:CheY-like chemotaxis protein
MSAERLEYTEEKAKILVVDDYAENRTVLEFILRNLDVVCYQAASCDEAISLSNENRFTLIFLDYHMPEKNGFEAARLIKNSKLNSRTPIIFLTADTESENLEIEGYEEGALDFIYKPLDPRKIRAKVTVLVDLAKRLVP